MKLKREAGMIIHHETNNNENKRRAIARAAVTRNGGILKTAARRASARRRLRQQHIKRDTENKNYQASINCLWHGSISLKPLFYSITCSRREREAGKTNSLFQTSNWHKSERPYA